MKDINNYFKGNFFTDFINNQLSGNRPSCIPSKSNIFYFLSIIFLLNVTIEANDFYPLNVIPINGSEISLGSTVDISFDVCLGYDFPAAAIEWRVEISIYNNNNRVYFETIQGFDANGPACYPISNVPDFYPTSEGTYYLEIQTYYDQEINSENDLLLADFVVGGTRDLAIVDIISPQPESEYFVGLDVEFKVLVRNEGDIPIKKEEYSLILGIQSSQDIENNFYNMYPDMEYDFEPKTERVFSIICRLGRNLTEIDINKALNFVLLLTIADDNPDNNSIFGDKITFIPNPMWPNEIGTSTGLNKLAKKSAGNDFIEFIVTDKFSKPELFKLTVFDSAGVQIDSTTLDLFTLGENVDSFTVYSYEFSGDVLPDHGAIAVSHDSLRFSDYFLSWGGEITAAEGLWKDSTSTDLGVTTVSGSSISLAGQGTDFSSFTWEVSTPTQGTFNDSQLVPVEEEYAIVNQFTLEQNYPNPFNPTTTIGYTIPASVKSEKTNVKLVVYDVLERQIKTLVNKIQSAGNYEVNLIASDLTSGVYYYRITAGEFMETRKMSLLK